MDFVKNKLWQDLSTGNKKVSIYIYIQNLFLHDIQSFQTKIAPNHVHQDTAVTISSRNGQNESQTTEFNSYQFAINSIKIINSRYVPLLLDILPRYSSNFFPLVWLVNCGNSFHFDSRIVKASRRFKNCVLQLHDAFAYLFLTNFCYIGCFCLTLCNQYILKEEKCIKAIFLKFSVDVFEAVPSTHGICFIEILWSFLPVILNPYESVFWPTLTWQNQVKKFGVHLTA